MGSLPAAASLDVYNALAFVPVRVNGAAPVWFDLDTGLEYSVLNADRAHAGGLAVSGERSEQAPGGAVALGAVEGVELALASDASPGTAGVGAPALVLLPRGRVRTLPLGAVEQVLGRPIAGILGHDVFLRYTVELDYAAGRVRFHDPSRYVAPAGAVSVPITIEHDEPFVEGTLIQPGRSPIPATLKLDVGSASGLGLNGSYVGAVRLVAPGQRVVPQPGIALGGETENFVTRLAALRLGPFEIARPVVGYSADTTRGGDAGTLGGEVLRRFTVVLDYARRRLLLTPNAAFGAPDEYDASGLFVTARGAAFDTVVVRSVLAGSPAAEAYIRPGDVLTAVDGRPASAYTLARLRDLLRQPGRAVVLQLARAGQPRSVRLRLRRLL